MSIELYDFQKECVDKLGTLQSVLIADEMGLGKTVEALARDGLIRDIYPDAATLVVTPGSVVSSWEEHCKMFGLTAKCIDPKNRDLSWKQYEVGPFDVFIVHWEALRLLEKNPSWQKFIWTHVIVDECHRMQNRKAQMTRALKRIKTQYKTALSGTPTTGRPDKFWSVLNWLYRKDYGSFWKFYGEHVDYKIKQPEGYHVINGPRNADELLAKIEPFYVRRLKQDVLTQLPPKVYQNMWVDLEPAQRKSYNEMKEDMVAWIRQQSEEAPLVAPAVIAQLVRLQQFACAHAELDDEGHVHLSEPSSKLDTVMDILEDNPDKQFVIFSNFKQLINLLATRLDREKITYGLLTGDVPQSERGAAVQRFQHGDSRIFLGTVQAGGVGITLTSASTVIFLNRDWSPALNLQAEDRLHRIGQTDSVQVIDIMARNTVDKAKAEMLTMKKKWIQTILGDI